jgi:signal transduction histidine kinase
VIGDTSAILAFFDRDEPDMIGELVDVTRLELGRTLDLTRQQTNLVSLVRRVVAERPEPADGGRFRIESSEPEIIGMWDPMRLERVLGNLLSNAAKYSPQDAPVRIEVGRERDATGDAAAVVRVADSGMGIPAANLPHIFERFHRAPNVAGKVRGTGLGLWGAAPHRRTARRHDRGRQRGWPRQHVHRAAATWHALHP